MAMLFFMPWCPIDKAYDLDCIRILPYRRGEPLEGLDGLQQSRQSSLDKHWMRCWRDSIWQNLEREIAEAISAEEARRVQGHGATQAASDAAGEE